MRCEGFVVDVFASSPELNPAVLARRLRMFAVEFLLARTTVRWICLQCDFLSTRPLAGAAADLMTITNLDVQCNSR